MKVAQVLKLGVLGFLFFLFVAIDLVLFGVIPLNSVMVTLLPLIGLLLCSVLGLLASRGRSPVAPAPATAGVTDQSGGLPPPAPG